MVRECVCSISFSINFIESQCAPAILCDVWWVWVCVRVCVLAPVCYRDIFAVHTQTRLHTAQAIATKSHSISIGLGCFLLLLYVWASSPLRSTHTIFLLLLLLFLDSSVCQALTHTLVCSLALATARSRWCACVFALPVSVCASRVNAIREIIIAVNVLLETTKQLQSSYISRRKEAKQ